MIEKLYRRRTLRRQYSRLTIKSIVICLRRCKPARKADIYEAINRFRRERYPVFDTCASKQRFVVRLHVLRSNAVLEISAAVGSVRESIGTFETVLP